MKLNGARNCKVNERLKRAAEPSAELKRPLFFRCFFTTYGTYRTCLANIDGKD